MHFERILEFATGVRIMSSEESDYKNSLSHDWAAWPLVIGRHRGRHPKYQQSLYKLLISHSGSQCKDPRDRVFALLGLVAQNERRSLERFLPDYTMNEDNVVLIALCHVRFSADRFTYEEVDVKRLLFALGVDSERRQRRLVRRASEYDYLGDRPPCAWWCWYLDEEAEVFNISNWGIRVDSDNGHSALQGSGKRRIKLILLTLGMTLLLRALMKHLRPLIGKRLIHSVSSFLWGTRKPVSMRL